MPLCRGILDCRALSFPYRRECFEKQVKVTEFIEAVNGKFKQ